LRVPGNPHKRGALAPIGLSLTLVGQDFVSKGDERHWGSDLAARNGRGIQHYPLALAATLGLFATWGLAHRIYEAITPQFADFFRLDSTQAALSRSVFTDALFLLAIPAALFLRRFGYKLGVVFGLSSFSVGALLLYPAIAQHQYLYFLAGVIVLGAGWAWLETGANPLIVSLGSADTAVRRLNLAQSFYPVGVVAGYEAGKWLARADLSVPASQLTQAVVRPYMIVGLCVLLVAFLIENLEFPPVATQRADHKERVSQEFRTLLARPVFRMDMAALAAYIFAHTALWTMMAGFIRAAMPAESVMPAIDLVLFMFLVFGAGRITGTALMYRFDPNRLLAVCAGASVLLTLAAVATGGRFGVFCLLSTNFFMSIMYPTIFGASVRGLGRLAKTASGLLVTAMGIGASAAPFAMSLAASLSSIRLAMVLPGACFAIVLVYVRMFRRGAAAVEFDEHQAPAAS